MPELLQLQATKPKLKSSKEYDKFAAKYIEIHKNEVPSLILGGPIEIAGKRISVCPLAIKGNDIVQLLGNPYVFTVVVISTRAWGFLIYEPLFKWLEAENLNKNPFSHPPNILLPLGITYETVQSALYEHQI